MWAEVDDDFGDPLGDLISCYDSKERRGFHLGIYSHGGVTNSQPNARQVHFGIDHAKVESEFADHGRLGDAVYVFSLCVHNGQLAESSGMKSEDYDLSIDSPLRIGFGAQDYFRGRITDVRLYRGELTATEIESKAALNPIDALRHE